MKNKKLVYVCKTKESFTHLQKKYIDIGYSWNLEIDIFIPENCDFPLILHISHKTTLEFGWDMYSDINSYKNKNYYKIIYFNLREEKLNRILK